MDNDMFGIVKDALPLLARLLNVWFVMCAIGRLGVLDEDAGFIDDVFRTAGTGIAYGFVEYQFHYLAHLWKSSNHIQHHAKPGDVPLQLLNEVDLAAYSLAVCVLAWLQVFYVDTLVYFLEWYMLYESFHFALHHPDAFFVPYPAIQWHNERHHSAPTKNLGVSTAGWDRLFRTTDAQSPDNLSRTALEFIPVIGWFL